MLEILGPGLHTTIQDAGRPDATWLGVPASGACDPLALAAANVLLGNPPDAAAIEMTLLGPELAVLAPCVIALAGADLQAKVLEDGRRLRPGTTHLLRAGSTLTFGAARDGARGYLALAGGVDVPAVLGSRSTAPQGGFGGIEGRPLQEGDLLRPAHPDVLGLGGRSWPGPGPSSGVALHIGPRTVHVIEGPHAREFPPDALELLLTTAWTVTPRSDRMGVRLGGPPLPAPDGAEPASLGMTWGAIEVPAGGAPIILLADHPTVGGYRVIAVAASVDRPVLGQLRAGDEVRFARIDVDRARALARDAATALHAADSRLRMAEPMA
ncbi:MAG: biotin-dependent carboxyltransferase family protein [Chloroflexota bacterium]